MSVIRPDGISLELLTTSLPYSKLHTTHNEQIFSTDETIKKNLSIASRAIHGSPLTDYQSEDIIFSKMQSNDPLKGKYMFLIDLYGVNSQNDIRESKLIVGGKAFGAMGTDELRRDLAIGLLWGTPLALFIGLVVAVAFSDYRIALRSICRIQRQKNRRSDDEVQRCDLCVASTAVSHNTFGDDKQ